MTGRNSIERRFPRERLLRLFGLLGTANDHEREVMRAAIDNLLREFNKGWADVIQLLGGNPD